LKKTAGVDHEGALSVVVEPPSFEDGPLKKCLNPKSSVAAESSSTPVGPMADIR